MPHVLCFPQQPQTLLTARLRLRPWQPADWPAFAALTADAEVMRHFPAPLSTAQSDALADELNRRIACQGWGFWAVEHLDTRQFIGFVGLNIPSADLPCSPCVEIGWRLARRWWGQGLASEAARAALEFAFTRLQLPEVVAFTAEGNMRSQAVMQRLGMQRDTATFEHPALPAGHPLRTHVLYRLAAPTAPAAPQAPAAPATPTSR